MPTDFYDVLGAPADASSEELKRAYRGRVREYHPDVNDHPEGDAQFKLVRKAHDVLSDPAERKDYDRMGHREYVDKRLDDIPSLSVFPDQAGERSTESTTETTVDRSGSVSSRTGSSGNPSGHSTSTSPSDTGASSSNRSAGSQSTGSARSSGRSQSSSQQSSSSRSTESTGSTRNGNGSARSRTAGSDTSSGTSRSTTPSETGSGRSTDTTSAGAEHSRSSWDEVTEQAARSGSTQSSTATGAARRRRGLRRWYGVVLLSLLVYLAGIGTYAAPYTERLAGLVAGLTTAPVTTLTSTFPLPSPAGYVLGTVSAAAAGEPGAGLLLLVGVVALPVVVLTAVAQFGQGSAWIYALASLGPVLPFAVARLATLPTALALVGLVVLPLFSGLGFLVDVGRYLYATR